MITEHADDGLAMSHGARWWTIANEKGSREIVRVVFQQGVDYGQARKTPEAPPEMVIFAIMEPGAFTHPPLVASALKMGTGGWKALKDQGIRISCYPEPTAKKLETMLVGMR